MSGSQTKVAFLQVRVSPEDYERIKRAAENAHLRTSTWARQLILRELDRLEQNPHE